MDEEGFLYLGDRKQDLIVSGGANICPADVEAAIDRHPEVVSCAVIGLPDEIVRYEIPRAFELVAGPVRDDAGKVRRVLLARERS